MDARRTITATALLGAFLSPHALGQGVFLNPDARASSAAHRPGPTIVSQELLQVEAEIRDGTATTTLRQTLHNHSATIQEAWWILPIPKGAVADRFQMKANGQTLVGEVLPAGKARAIYEQIVRRRRDPGLLEYVDCGMLRARVFPIPPGQDMQVEVRYSEVLAEQSGIYTYSFPLRTAWLGDTGPNRLGLRIDIVSQGAIKTIWSPNPEIEIERKDDHSATAGMEQQRTAPSSRDLSLHFGIADRDFGVHVLTHRHAGQDGYFLAMVAPRRDWPQPQQMRRVVQLVMDTSGSMRGEKMKQAIAAVESFVGSLAPQDWFNVIPFSTDARPFFTAPVPAHAENVKLALERTAKLQAQGGTNIEDALRQAVSTALPDDVLEAQRNSILPVCVFVTDGVPTVGTTDIDGLLAGTKAANDAKTRIFTFGLGDDVNTRLLDSLATASRADRAYVRPGEDLEVATASLFAKLHGPVLTDVRLIFDGLEVQAVEPNALPDLFIEGQLVVIGRYRGTGSKAIRLSGKLAGAEHEQVFEATFPEVASGCDWLPALWAQRRVAALLEAVRKNGQQRELIDEIRQLGRTYGIVTPYTSHLIVEEGERLARDTGLPIPRTDAVGDSVRDQLQREWARRGALPTPAGPTTPGTGSRPLGPDSDSFFLGLRRRLKAESVDSARLLDSRAEVGSTAVNQSVALRRMATGGVVRPSSNAAMVSQRVGDHVLHLVGSVWVDVRFEPEMKDRVRRIAAFSSAYFDLLRTHPQLASVLAFSPRLLLVLPDGSAVEIHDPAPATEKPASAPSEKDAEAKASGNK
jgi:Mg-chelatase subunit ChlD